jgi:hypothetical protein
MSPARARPRRLALSPGRSPFIASRGVFLHRDCSGGRGARRGGSRQGSSAPASASGHFSPPGPVFTGGGRPRVVCWSGLQNRGGPVADMIWDRRGWREPPALLRATTEPKSLAVRRKAPCSLGWNTARWEGALTGRSTRARRGAVREIASNRSDRPCLPHFALSVEAVYYLFIARPRWPDVPS